MSRQAAADTLPPTARAIALLLASTPTVQDAQPGVLHQLLEFAHRYTTQVLSDAQVYADHAGRAGKIEMDDVVLAVQARVGWEFGGRVPKEYILSLSSQINAIPLPAVPEVFGVRLPPPSDSLTSVDFDLVPNKPPPGVKLYDEEIEEVEESEEEEDEDEDMEPAPIPPSLSRDRVRDFEMKDASKQQPPVGPVSAMQDVGTVGGEDVSEEEDGLFAGGEDEEEEEEDESGAEEAMEEVQMDGPSTNGVKRKLVEEEDYD